MLLLIPTDGSQMIDLHYWPTPNGKKISIFLEETETPYKLVPVNIGRGDQFAPEFLRLNPNHRMPVIVDHAPSSGGAPISVFESGAILFYLAEKTGKLWPQDLRTRYDIAQWVIWQVANQGPKLGEAGHFRRLGDKEGDQSYAVRRFTDEANRLYGVLNARLRDRRYIGGDKYSIADIVSYPWTVGWKAQGQEIDDFKHFKRWFEEVGARPGVQRGLEVGMELTTDVTKLTEEEQNRIRKILYNQRALPVPD